MSKTFKDYLKKSDRQEYSEEESANKIEVEKDGFRKGEWSIYKRKYRDGEVSYESYLVGITKKNEAEAVAALIRKMM